MRTATESRQKAEGRRQKAEGNQASALCQAQPRFLSGFGRNPLSCCGSFEDPARCFGRDLAFSCLSLAIASFNRFLARLFMMTDFTVRKSRYGSRRETNWPLDELDQMETSLWSAAA